MESDYGLVGAVIAFVYGTIFGSFLAAWYYRLMNDKPIAKGRSACPHCKHQLGVFDLVPILSWLALRGRCRYCKHRLSRAYPLIEWLTGALAVGAYLKESPDTPAGIAVTALVAMTLGFFLLIGLYDLKTKYIPMLPLYAASVCAALVVAIPYVAVTDEVGRWLPAVAGAAVMGLFFWAIHAVTKGKALGFGDVLLVLPIGLFLGIYGAFWALFLGSTAGSIVSLSLIKTKRLSRKDTIPFGPYLVGGVILAYFLAPMLSEYFLGTRYPFTDL